jgi:hypothetical protein
VAKYSKFDSSNKKRSKDKYRAERKKVRVQDNENRKKIDYEKIDISSLRRQEI